MIKYLTAGIIMMVSVTANAATFTVSGDTLTMRGEIEYGDHLTFNNKFNSSIKKIVLTSVGGNAFSAIEMGNKINQRTDVIVTAKTQCTSACAMMWMSGHKHYKSVENVIGFHLPYLPDESLIEKGQLEGYRGVSEEAKLVSVRFILQMSDWMNNKSALGMFTKGMYERGLFKNEMWYPTNAELTQIEGAWTKQINKVTLVDKNWRDMWSNVTATTVWDSNKSMWKTTIKFRAIIPHKVFVSGWQGKTTDAKQIGINSAGGSKMYGRVYSNTVAGQRVMTIYSKRKPTYILLTNESKSSSYWTSPL